MIIINIQTKIKISFLIVILFYILRKIILMNYKRVVLILKSDKLYTIRYYNILYHLSVIISKYIRTIFSLLNIIILIK